MKRFKALFMSLVLVTCMLGTSVPAKAEVYYHAGSAYIPMFVSFDTGRCIYNVSNITDHPMFVTVVLFDASGTIVKDDKNINTGRLTGSEELINYSDQNSDNTSISFTLNPHTSGTFYVQYTAPIYHGYGTITWEQGGDTTLGMVAHGMFYNSTEKSRVDIPINGGMPF